MIRTFFVRLVSWLIVLCFRRTYLEYLEDKLNYPCNAIDVDLFRRDGIRALTAVIFDSGLAIQRAHRLFGFIYRYFKCAVLFLYFSSSFEV